MTDHEFDLNLSRRKVLGALGAVGAASAGAGLGTSAYFSDTESFENNQLTAGELDLKVDWEEHYYDGSAEGAETAESVGDADYVLPALEPVQRLRNGEYRDEAPVTTLKAMSDAKPIALNFTDGKDAFWDATSIEAFPDSDGDGIQDAEYEPCTDGADTPEDLDPVEGLRTQNDDTYDAEEETVFPLVNLDDVKPGDFGEVTLSAHLCDNPGYLWLQGELLKNAENGVTEPEAKDKDEDDGEGVADPNAGDDTSGELAQNIMTRLWYDDDCDNQVDEEMGDLDIVLAVDTSGSIRGGEQQQMRDGVNEFIEQLPTNGAVRVGTLTFGNDQVGNVQDLDTPDNVSVALPSFGGNTPMPAALDVADQLVRDTTRGARDGAQKTIVMFTDGGPNYGSKNYTTNGFEAPRGTDDPGYSADDTTDGYDEGVQDSTVSEGEMSETAIVSDTVRGNTTRIATVFVGEDDSTDAMSQGATSTYGTLPNYLESEIASPGFNFTVAFADLEGLAQQLQEAIVVGEEVFFLGTLSEALDRLGGGNGIPLDGDLTTAFDELTDGPTDEGRECFPSGSTHCVGFEWWLPLNHANQIQSDSVSFDLGFYTEQCRHNDGSGPDAEA
ncbi:VWA domain-containing protein [Halobellus sp. Atlit-31R]|nr:VWA domain-containing protein [Halobellus sp. Atlit-31R]